MHRLCVATTASSRTANDHIGVLFKLSLHTGCCVSTFNSLAGVLQGDCSSCSESGHAVWIFNGARVGELGMVMLTAGH
jgi:hypothetical protein